VVSEEEMALVGRTNDLFIAGDLASGTESGIPLRASIITARDGWLVKGGAS
jgi:hypothetical protein